MTETAPQAEVLIIGAGASGGVAARRLAEAGVDVVCLEQGDWPDRASFRGGEAEGDLIARGPWSSSPAVRRAAGDYPINAADSDIAPLNFNGVGGGTVLYSAQWPRMLPEDFRVGKVDGAARDWPLSYEDLQPYYERIDQQFMVSGLGGNPAYPAGAEPPLPALPIGKGGLLVARAHARLGWHWWPETNAIASVDIDGTRHRCAQRGTCSQGCGEGAKASTDLTHWPAAVTAGARLITGARVRELHVDRQGRITGADWVDQQGGEHFTAAQTVLLAANGIGTPRLLLQSTSGLFPDGLANSSGLVGRRLMLHPLASVVGLFDEELESWRGQAGALIQSMQFYRSDPARGFIRGARWSLSPGGGALKAALARGRLWGSGHHAYMRERLGRSVSWTILAEDLPDPANRVTMSAEIRDGAGVPGAVITYHLSDNSRRLLAWHAEKAAESLVSAGAYRTEYVPQPANGHFLGTACMGDDPRDSVVDRWGICHDVPNLGIIDGSVFVTAGGVNPTPTICALALRTVEHLLEQRGRPDRRPRQSVASTSVPNPGVVIRLDTSPPLVLNTSDRALLGKVADALIPGNDRMPSASEVDVHGTLLERVLRARPDLFQPLQRALELVRAIAGSTDDVVGRAVETVRRDDTAAASVFELVIAGGYYMSAQVRNLLGYPIDVSQPVSAAGFPDYVEAGLLDHLFEVPTGPPAQASAK
jgi:choline dehydrogenase-like flavoprotein